MPPQLSSTTRVALGLSSLALGAAVARRTWRSRYSFRGRTVVLTGASRGLGLELARQLAAEGARLWLVARSPDPLHAAADELRQTPAAFVDTIAADVRREEEIDRVVERVLRAGDVVDVLINNAGTIAVSPFEHAQREDFEDSLATHFWAPLLLTRKLLPRMRRGGEGRIVNISSVGGRIGVPHLSAYAAGKFALTGLSETLRAELMKSGISVTTVTPGLMRTGSYVNVRLRGRQAEEFRWFAIMQATSLTSMQTRRAASQIIEAVRRGRATVSPGWQSRVAQIVSAAAPNVASGIRALADGAVLPRPSGTQAGDEGRLAAEVDPGEVKRLLSAKTRRTYHQPRPVWG
jgi:short-subunit dehydrogenase